MEQRGTESNSSTVPASAGPTDAPIADGDLKADLHIAPVYARPSEQTLKILAHQGYQGEHVPNSFAAITAAFGVADAVEFDLYAIPRTTGSAELELVCCHPEGYFLFVDSNGMKNTENLPLSYEEAREVVVRGQPMIPRLVDVIDCYAERCAALGKRTELQIELKGPGTAAAVIEPMQQMIAESKIGYEDFLLSGLCYPGDRTRIEDAHRADPNIRMILPLRGGDFSEDGFSGWSEVLDFATDNGVTCITVARKGVTVAGLQRIKDAGIDAGVFHSRTSDELEAALALGADYVAADFYRGPSYQDYPGVRLTGSPLFHEIAATGFYTLRDWIWELGWECEGLRRNETERKMLLADRTPLALDPAVDAALQHSFSDNTIYLQLCEHSKLSGAVMEYSLVPIAEKYLGAFDAAYPERTFGFCLSQSHLENSYRDLIEQVAAKIEVALPELPALQFEAIVQISEGNLEELLRRCPQELAVDQIRILQETGRELLTRAGRLVGMLAFTALMPRHMERDEFVVMIDSPVTALSHWARLSASQQVDAQLLRSGKRGQTIIAQPDVENF